jgi:hypothetical protein
MEKPPDSRSLFIEHRREPRLPAQGTVRLRLGDNCGCAEVDGHLVDVSGSGFRAAHQCRSLQTGEEVEFEHPQGSGRARVIWLRITAAQVESGFLITQRS